MEAIIKKGDVIGNTKDKFRFQVIEVLSVMGDFFKVLVEDIATFERFEVTSDEMNFQGYKYQEQICKK
jgi:hypothetical protein